MKILDLFDKQLDRAINGVVKAEQVDNDVVWNELDEYVVTKELDKHLRRFFEAYTESIHQKTDNMGVWVSGFFGSGKSHFIKILSYLLENKTPTERHSGIEKSATAFFDDKISDKALFGEIMQATSKPTEVLLFNIDAKADSKRERDVVLQVFTRVFNEHQGFSGDHPHIAFMERYLQKKGKLDLFKEEFEKNAGSVWEEERDAWQFQEDALCAALAVALGKAEDAAKTWFEKSEEDFVLTIEKFSGWVKEYLDEKGPEHRILFFVDEVGQFIGNDTHLMLNLQTITENLGSACDGKAWVVVTSQEDIDAVLGEFRSIKEQDFSKIQGRFKTRLSLSSSNTDEVIGMRLLKKSPEATKMLSEIFDDKGKGDILKNQVSFTGTKKVFANYSDAEAFAGHYPFAPYHFELVQKIFEAIRKAGATGVHLAQGERSMLDAFQTAALSIRNQEIGALVPLYRFYPAIESFLDTTVKRTIDQAGENEVIRKNALDVELLRTLFLIRYVDDMPGNIDNLVTLCVTTIDEDKLKLRREVEESLDRLEGQNLVSRNGDLYAFLTSEEQDVGREIKAMSITSTEENRKIASLLFDDVLKSQNKHRYQANKTDYDFSRYCDGHLFGSKKEEDIAVSMITAFGDGYATYNPPQCINASTERGGQLLFKLHDQQELAREVTQYLKTDKFVTQKTDESNPETLKRILHDKAAENRERNTRLKKLTEEMLLAADVYAAGQTLKLKEKGAPTLLADGLDYIMQNTFGRMDLLKHTSKDSSAAQAETAATLAANDIQQIELEIQKETDAAAADVLQYIELKSGKDHQIVLADLVSRYESRPYGWPTYDIVLLLARLLVVGEITAKMDGKTLTPQEAQEPFKKSTGWKKVTLRKRKTTSTAIIKQARELGKDLFELMSPSSGEKEVFDFFGEQFGKWEKALKRISGLVKSNKYPGKAVVENGLDMLSGIRQFTDYTQFFEELLKSKNDWLDLAEEKRDVLDFFKYQQSTWEELQTAVNSTYKSNFHALMNRESAKKAMDDIAAILQNANPYKELHKAAGLLSTLKEQNEKLMEAVKPAQIHKIEENIAHVKSAFEEASEAGKAVSDDIKNTALRPLQEMLSKAKSSMEVPGLQNLVEKASEAMDVSLEVVEKATNPEPKEMKLPITQVSAAIYSKGKAYLETPEDIDAFVTKFKAELLKLIETNRVKLK